MTTHDDRIRQSYVSRYNVVPPLLKHLNKQKDEHWGSKNNIQIMHGLFYHTYHSMHPPQFRGAMTCPALGGGAEHPNYCSVPKTYGTRHKSLQGTVCFFAKKGTFRDPIFQKSLKPDRLNTCWRWYFDLHIILETWKTTGQTDKQI